MAVSQTLITPEEVKQLAKERWLSPCDMNDIRQVEKSFARNCLGKTLYDALLDDLEDYSTRPTWSANALANEVFQYKGFYYKALVNTTNEPSVKADWVAAPKFGTTANNDLWCEVLGRHLALLVIQSTLPSVSTPVTGQGTVKRKGGGFDPATEDEILRRQHSIAANLVSSYENLDEYLVANGFTAYSGYTTTTCCNVSTSPDYQLFFSGGLIGVESVQNSSSDCGCRKCTARLKTLTNRYVIA